MTRTDIARYRRVIDAAARVAQFTDNGLLEFARRALNRWPLALDEVERLRNAIDAARALLARRRPDDALHVLDCSVASPGFVPPTEKEIEDGWVP